RYDYAEIIDLNFLFNILNGVVHIQELLQQEVGWAEPIFAKARLLNVWRSCPFLDVGTVLDLFENHGIPICLDRKVEILPGTDPETFIEIPYLGDLDTEVARVTGKATILFMIVLRAFGI